MIRIAILSLIFIVAIGCSEKQKEADRLAADLRAMQSKADSAKNAADSTEAVTDTQAGVSDTIGESAPAPDTLATQGLPPSQEVATGESSAPADTASVGQQTSEPVETTAATVEPIMPPRPVDDGYVVQIASTNDPTEARAISARFSSYGYPAFPQAATVDGVVWYRVRVGPYPTMEEAASVLTELNLKYQVSGWVAKHR